MDIESFRSFCLNIIGTTEDMKWGNLCFLIEEKIFVLVAIDDGCRFAVKCDPNDFDELTDLEGIQQAYHMAKRQWIQVENLQVLNTAEIKALVLQSRALVLAKLPKRVQEKYAL